MNNKGSIALVSLMFGFLIIIAILAMATAMKDIVSEARTNLDCTNTSLSAGETGTCIIVDWTYPGYIGLGLIVGIGFIVFGRKALSGQG